MCVFYLDEFKKIYSLIHAYVVWQAPIGILLH